MTTRGGTRPRRGTDAAPAEPATPTGPAVGSRPAGGPGDGGECGEQLLSIGAAAARAGVTERALRYYQELGILNPSGHTKGGMRRYSQADLDRVARIRELQVLLGLNLDEIAELLRNEDRTAEIRAAYFDRTTGKAERKRLLRESLGLATDLRRTVEAKREALDAFLADLDARIARINAALEDNQK